MNLSSMVEFMTKDVKPLEVIIHFFPTSKRRLFLKPQVIASAEFRERGDTDLLQHVDVNTPACGL